MRFLITDDDAVCRELLCDALSPYAQCDTAYDGHEAINAVRIAHDDDEPYDLVLLDIMMPGCDGHEALAGIRRLEESRHILGNDGVPVIMTTALKESRHCIQAFREGCETYLTKPVNRDALLRTVNTLVGPLPEIADEANSSNHDSSARPHEDAPPERPKRILICDDDRICRELLSEMLEPYGACDIVHHGREALEAAHNAIHDQRPYDLICLDIMMPGMNGHEALTAIRQIEEAHGIGGSSGACIMMMTALDDSKHCLQAFREGCECYLTKPLDHGQLAQKLAQFGFAKQDREPAGK